MKKAFVWARAHRRHGEQLPGPPQRGPISRSATDYAWPMRPSKSRWRHLFALVVAGAAFAVLFTPGAVGAIPVGPFSGDVSTSQTAHANFLSVTGSSDCLNGAASPSVTTD